MGEESHLLDFCRGEQKVIEWIVMDLLAMKASRQSMWDPLMGKRSYPAASMAISSKADE